jgi:hypothetical protein
LSVEKSRRRITLEAFEEIASLSELPKPEYVKKVAEILNRPGIKKAVLMRWIKEKTDNRNKIRKHLTKLSKESEEEFSMKATKSEGTISDLRFPSNFEVMRAAKFKNITLTEDQLKYEAAHGRYFAVGDPKDYNPDIEEEEESRRREIVATLEHIKSAYDRKCSCCPKGKINKATC